MTVTVRHGTYHLSTRNGGLISGFIWENHGNIISGIYPLVMTVTVRHGFSMALIEIDGCPPSYKMGGFSMANCNSHNQMVIKLSIPQHMVS